LCIKSFSSAGNIDLEGSKLAYTEADSLDVAEEEEGIDAAGTLKISLRKGKTETVLSAWSLEEEVSIPPVGETALEGFELEAASEDLGESVCEVKIEAAVESLYYPTIETTGGLTIPGKLKVEAEED